MADITDVIWQAGVHGSKSVAFGCTFDDQIVARLGEETVGVVYRTYTGLMVNGVHSTWHVLPGMWL